ncbi:MAG: endonuclease domain-containing protein [Rhodothermales bacterium]
MRLNNLESLKSFRRQLRNRSTIAEAVLWPYLNKRKFLGKKFRRQHSVGPFILDFYCPDEKLAIELDGTVHDYSERIGYDERRTVFLEKYGIRVVRVTNKQVLESVEDVLEYIAGFFGDS